VNLKLDYKPKKLLQEVLDLGLSGMYLSITIALRIFVSLPALVVSSERTFNVLKQVMNCEISSSHGGEYDVQSCLMGYTAV
jgi:hypothetical protein